jgi:hypothetical protein
MKIAETSVFTKLIVDLMSDDEYRGLQMELVARPDAGALVVGGGGIRKIRWGVRGRSKRDGVRVIYYWAVAHDTILMLFTFPKNEQEDLTDEQTKALSTLVKKEYK